MSFAGPLSSVNGLSPREIRILFVSSKLMLSSSDILKVDVRVRSLYRQDEWGVRKCAGAGVVDEDLRNF